jgi:predicted nucleic acid-binding protein
MCIVIDTNSFASVFDAKSDDHPEFRPVLNWITNGKGKIVYGGTKYRDELRAAQRYLGVFGELARARKVVEIPDVDVDREQERIENLVLHRDFDDPHIVAIVSVSRCKLVCSRDKRAYRFIKDVSLYPKAGMRPKIYSDSNNSDLLCDHNIADCCK